jgi:hypothetical protein
MAFVRDQTIFMLVAAAAGIGWTLSASELWVAAQRSMPSWSRGRMNATVIMVSQGAMALGGVVWGVAATTLGLHPTLIGGAVLLSISLILAIPLSINFTGKLEFDPGSVASFSQTSFSHKLIALPQPQDGPVAITYEFEVDRLREDEFMELMRQVRLIHLRNGAFSWQLHEDLTQFNIFRVEMIVPSWTQYVLQRDRMTKAEKNIIERAKRLHIGEDPIREGIFLCVNKELVSHRPLAERQWRLQKRSP